MSAARHQDLQGLMTAEVETLDRLEAALEQENSALRGNDLEALEQAVADKQTALAELQQSDAARRALVEQAGYEPGTAAGVERFIESAPDGDLIPALTQQWRLICEKLERCRDQNAVNGQLVEASRQYAHQSLSILLGNEAPDSETYDRDGGKSPAGGGRSYDRA